MWPVGYTPIDLVGERHGRLQDIRGELALFLRYW